MVRAVVHCFVFGAGVVLAGGPSEWVKCGVLVTNILILLFLVALRVKASRRGTT
jgi:hypothetical protein